ncbi:hypothetical protein Tco_1351586 [Tanacetum coccineum]
MAARGQNQGNGKNKHAYAPKPKIPPLPKREDPAKDSISMCVVDRTLERNCPLVPSPSIKKKKNAASGAGGGSGTHIEYTTYQSLGASSANYDLDSVLCGIVVLVTSARIAVEKLQHDGFSIQLT